MKTSLNIKAALAVAQEKGCNLQAAHYGLSHWETKHKQGGLRVMMLAGIDLATITKLVHVAQTTKETHMGDIGEPERFIEIEPLHETTPAQEPAPEPAVEPVIVPEKEPVPA